MLTTDNTNKKKLNLHSAPFPLVTSTSICQRVQLGQYYHHDNGSEHLYLGRILGPGHSVLRAPVVGGSPVEVKLLESIDP